VRLKERGEGKEQKQIPRYARDDRWVMWGGVLARLKPCPPSESGRTTHAARQEGGVNPAPTKSQCVRYRSRVPSMTFME
jgi:hypothetical protein